MLYKYLSHRVLSLPFTYPAYIVEKDSIFVPTGWDSKAKLEIIKETIKDPDVPILQNDDPILPLIMGNRFNGAGDIEVEDEQVFLNRLASIAITNESVTNGSNASNPSPKRDHSVGKSTQERNTIGANSNPLQGNDNTALMSFFNNLLKKDTGGNN